MHPERLMSGLLIVTLTTPAGFVHAADNMQAPMRAPGIRAAALQAAQALAVQAAPTPATPASPTPRTLPRTGQASKQMSGGGGSMTMVMGLVSTAAGVAGSYFVYKSLKNQNDKTQAATTIDR